MRRVIIVCVGMLAAVGCGKPGRTPLFGRVTVAGKPVDSGGIRFVPLDDDGRGPAKIVTEVPIQADGTYRCATLDGIPPGRYRVEVDARRKTGRRTVRREDNGEDLEVEEAAPVGAKTYAGPGSPLTLDTATTAVPFDIDVPAS